MLEFGQVVLGPWDSPLFQEEGVDTQVLLRLVPQILLPAIDRYKIFS
jgi:hypothetical protein